MQRAGGDRKKSNALGRPRVVVAALAASLVAAFGFSALAPAAASQTSATVTIQLASRGLGGRIDVKPAGLDENNKSSSTCNQNQGQNSCTLTYSRGQDVTLTAAGSTLSSWSSPDCPGAGECKLKLDDDATSVVAVFDPLQLVVRMSPDNDAAQVTTDPVGKKCAVKPDDFDESQDTCFEFHPGTSVKVTVKSNGPAFKEWNPGCEPTNQPTTCVVTVLDEPTWVGARFAGGDRIDLPTTISVQFRLKRGGTGTGRVLGQKLDCGTVCSGEYDYGKSMTLSAAPEGGSSFDGWNGVCSKSQTTCTFPVGPITSIKANFSRDTAPPSAPGALTVTTTTRTSIGVSWSASTDNVGVSGYRVYLNDTSTTDTQGTTYSFADLVCGHSYTVAVDAVDALGNRSTRSTLATGTQACALAARVAGVGVQRSHQSRQLLVKLRVNRATSARLLLQQRRLVLVGRRYGVSPGTNTLRLIVPRTLKGGSYRLAISLANPDGGTLVLPTRGVLLPRAR
jgi:hypothetical protein